MPYVPPLWSFTPFLVILLCIAVLPLLPRVDHWWHRNGNKLLVAGILALLTLGFYAFLHQGMLYHGHTIEGTGLVLKVLQHAVLEEYIPFIVLLFSLYTISGGILITGDIEARPMTNLAYLTVGTLLASFIGTTGASMLLIRPLLRTNAERRHKVHTVVFFILLVSNIGGSLTPLGDPPLFLGFLRGVPFWWPAQNLALPWGMASLLLLSVYFLWDVLAYRKETPRAIRHDEAQVTPLGCVGGINFVWLVGVVACVALVDHNRVLPGTDWKPFPFLREGLLLLLAVLSWITTARNAEIRKRNDFNFFAIAEVACLFIGIFICMQPALEYLNIRGSELGVQTPAQFFWASGLFSSFLDNAPTYVVFFETAKALTASGGLAADAVVQVADGSVATNLLLAISVGSVFMGANTYIGNAPNFMVKSIAESSGVRMPSFFGYFVFAVAVLAPVYLLVTFLFFS
jgi:Na+/H+ antiporter NhaD/arsenite permease-like protein